MAYVRPQLSLKGAGLPFCRTWVKKHGAETGQDLGGGGDGKFPRGHDQSHSVSSLQGQDQAQRRGAAAVTVRWWRRRFSRQEAWRVQLLDAAVGYRQNRLHPLTSLGRENSGYQVAAVCRSCEDTWERTVGLIIGRPNIKNPERDPPTQPLGKNTPK